MTTPETEELPVSLGELLQQRRLEKGFDLHKVSEETRISPTTLKAMERGEYSSLPADAFARGFYALYAGHLGLEPDSILKRYEQEKLEYGQIRKRLTPPGARGKKVGNMAERPGTMPTSYIGLFFLLLLAFGAFICWYFSWNPATFLSEKLRSFQTPPANQEQMQTNTETKPAPPEKASPVTVEMVSASSQPPVTAANPVQEKKYYLKLVFTGETSIRLVVDDQPALEKTYTAGETAEFSGDDRLLLTLPAHPAATASLNDIPLIIPETTEQTITLTLPEHLLQ